MSAIHNLPALENDDAGVIELAEMYKETPTKALYKHLKAIARVLEMRANAAEKKLSKLEEKEEKRSVAAPAKGVRPPQLQANTDWVNFVHQHALANGWPTFKHLERCGQGMAEVDYPESEIVDVPGVGPTHVFRGIVPHVQPNLSHAMSLSRKYKTDLPQLHQLWLSTYEPSAPIPGSVPAAKPARVVMTLAEKLAAKQAEKEEKEAEKQRKKKEREAKKAEKEAEKEAEKQRKLIEKAAKAAPSVGILRAAIPALMPAAPAAPVVAAAPAVSAIRPPRIARPVVAPVPDVEPMKWNIPDDNECHEWTWNGTTYIVNSEGHAWLLGADRYAGAWVGQVLPKENRIDYSVPEPKPDDDNHSDSDSDSDSE